jgi:D-xylose transport system substrate-binding protein
MSMRKMATIAGMTAILVAACGGGGATTAPSTAASASASAPASAEASASDGASPSEAAAGDCTVGVSWNNFQQPRWAAHDQPNIKDTVEAGGGTYIDADANLSNEQQLTDVDTLISKGAKVLILLAQDNKAILPALQKAKDAGIPVIAYDRLIEDPDILYITFDNVLVGKAEAEAVLAKVPSGNYVLIKGDPGDANASTFLPQGWDEAGLKAKVDAGEITILNMGGTEWPKDAGTYTDAWKTETAQKNMEAIIDKAVADGTKIDAILAENDSTALGVVGALTSKSYGYPPLSGQDGDPANLNNVALGKQYVDVFKNANELGKAAGAAALELCKGTAMTGLTLPDGLLDPTVAPTAGLSAQSFTTPGGTAVQSFILQPTPLTAETLQTAIDAGQITKEDLCKGVDPATAPPACK